MTAPAESSIRLKVRYPHGATESYALVEGKVLRVGRHEGNEIVLPFNRVSRFHGVFSVVQNQGGALLVFSDLNSLNGSFLNGKRVSSPVTLGNGDTVLIADTSFRAELSGESEASDPGTTQSLGMEVIQATILVSDVRGYTTLSENLPAQHVAEMLQRWLGVCTVIIEEHGGEIDKYIGDSVMAFWRGLETAEPALRAALEIQRATGALASEWPYAATHPWRSKTSLNTGEVLCGTVGVGDARKLTVLGDAVNVVFRLNDVASEAGEGIILGRETASWVKEKHRVKFLRNVTVEGKAEPVEVYVLPGS